MKKSTYSQKLLDPRWQKKRLEVLQRDNWTCQLCLDTENTLHVHHRCYEKGRDPWDIDSKHLVTLCAACHEIEEVDMREALDMLVQAIRRTPFDSYDVKRLAEGIEKFTPIPDENKERICAAYAYAFSNIAIQEKIVQTYLNSD